MQFYYIILINDTTHCYLIFTFLSLTACDLASAYQISSKLN